MEFGVLWMRLPSKVRPTIAMGEGRRGASALPGQNFPTETAESRRSRR